MRISLTCRQTSPQGDLPLESIIEDIFSTNIIGLAECFNKLQPGAGSLPWFTNEIRPSNC
jgi:hypothetical protein